MSGAKEFDLRADACLLELLEIIGFHLKRGRPMMAGSRLSEGLCAPTRYRLSRHCSDGERLDAGQFFQSK